MAKPYQVLSPTAPVPAPDDVLEMIVREGARKMLQSALEKEVDEFLGRGRYERTTEQRGYRNGHLPKRSIGVGMGAVEVSLPRVSDVPKEVSPDGFQSEIVASYQRRSRTQARLMVRLYLEGLASGDFEPIFRALVGETAALSASSIVRLKEEWQQEYETWKKRPLRGRYVYLFADGLYLKAGGEQDKTAVLVVLGVDEQGHKELLAMEEGYRESTVAWAETLRSLKARGRQGGAALGRWRWRTGIVGGARRGLPHDPPSAVLEPPHIEYPRQTAQAPVAGGAQAGAQARRSNEPPGVRASAGCAVSSAAGPGPGASGCLPGTRLGGFRHASTISRKSIGCTCAPATRSSPSSPASDCARPLPSGCACGRTRSTWSSSW